MNPFGSRTVLSLVLGPSCLVCWQYLNAAVVGNEVEATTLHGKVMCGYQGWFRCPGDAANMGWIHWSHTAERIAPETLCFEMWPDMNEYGPGERFVVPALPVQMGLRLIHRSGTTTFL